MSYHKPNRIQRPARRPNRQAGFTLVELTVVIAVIGVIAIPFYAFMNTTINQYIALQAEGTGMADLASQSQRIANVMRGVTTINTATADSIDCYAYFAPSDAYVSRIKYYKNAANTKLFADVTRMTANPPTGTEIASSKRTFTIIPNFYQAAGVSTFTYLDAAGAPLTLPVSDQRTIKNIKVTLAVPGAKSSKNSSQTNAVQVSLRNRKSNL